MTATAQGWTYTAWPALLAITVVAAGVVAGAWVAAMVWTIWMAVRAPDGYEDETGFHYGRPGENRRVFDALDDIGQELDRV